MRICVPDPSGPFCESNESRSLNPGARPAFGPALSPGILLVKVFGRLIVVLVASSVPVNAGCGRPEIAESLKSDCSRVAFGLFERVCAVVRSISFMTEFTSVCSTFGLSGKTSLRVVRHRGAGVHFLQQLVERFLLIRQLHVGLVRLGLRRRIRLIHARLVERLDRDRRS